VPFDITIERIIPGGRGLSFHKGRPVFVPFSAPGDLIRVISHRDRKSYLEATSAEVLSAAPCRREPLCIHFSSCGGCDFQHIEVNTQLEAKRGILVDALRRIGKIHYPASQIGLIPSPPWSYRNRVQIKISSKANRYVWGFYRMGSHQIVSLDNCLITSQALWHFLNKLMKWLENQKAFTDWWSGIEIFQGDAEQFLVSFRLNVYHDSLERFGSRLQEWGLAETFPNASFHFSSGRERSVLVSGSGFVSKTIGDLTYLVGPDSFFQINDSMLTSLHACATAGCFGDIALDLYSGVGFFSLALARTFGHVLAVEVSPAACRDLQRNLEVNHVCNCQLFSQEAGAFISDHRSQLKDLDLILLDPPRAGLPMKTVAEVAELRVPKVVYVSCDPSTLSRDLGIFLKYQYEIASLDILDLFPQTHHLETVAKLHRS
jgi:23S rRNA (uracil1939-C5)-methyltransferase